MQQREVGVMKRFGRLLVTVLLMAVALPLTAPSAYAEDDLLEASDPYRHQELTDPPSGVVLAFTREVDAAAAQIVVTNSAGENVNINSLIVEGTNVTAQVKPNLPRDTYTVHYQVNREDGEVEGGAFQFAYGKGTWTKLPDERWSGNTAQPTVIASAEPGTAPPETETPVPSESPTLTPVPSDTASAVVPETPEATPTPVAGNSAAPWLWGGGAAVVLAAIAGTVLWRRRGSGTPGRRTAE